VRLTAAALAVLIAGCASSPGADFSFALIGDLGYRPAQEPMVDNVMRALNAEPLAFVVHDGDLGSPPNGSCTDELWARRLRQFRRQRVDRLPRGGGRAGLRAARAAARASSDLLRR